ncbi:MAG: hypothetical protein AMJ43_10975 [Coxiella sp. DG_40]|nr:MAG: hypothetical protein AMJ43_10975 [Coxiella sp. DG_40]
MKEKHKRKITGWRLWLFRFIAVTFIPALLILALELGLRLTGYGYQARAIIKCKVKGQKAYCDNIKFGWLFFPPNIAREFSPFVIPSQKSENTYRIFVFGASAAQGVPDSAYSFSRILEIILSEQYPGVNFEVINTAMTAINSHMVVKIAKDCAQHEPDLFVVYLGNNEVIGPYGAGTVFAPLSEHLSLIHLGIAFRGTRLGQLLTYLLQATKQKNIPKVWGGMSMFLDKQLSADDERLQIVYNNYNKNLESVINIAQKRGTAVILTTVGTNLKDCAPFASVHRNGLSEDEKKSFEEIYKEAIDYDEAGQYAQALEKYLAAADIDGQFAELQFRLGRCYFLLGQYPKAKQRYIRARELDTVRLRADNRINEIIREIAQNKSSDDVYVADAVRALEGQNPYQIPGGELFYEHVHLNFKGNYILAKSIFEQIEKILPERIKSRRLSKQEVVDEYKCMHYLAYSDWDQYTIMQSLLNNYIVYPPFTNQLYHNEQVESLEQQINSLKDNLSEQVLLQVASDYRKAIETRPTDWMLHWKYGRFLMDGLKDYRMAVAEYDKTLELVPHYYMVHVMLGTIWGRSGDYDKAMGHFNEAVEIKPSYAPGYYDIGLLYQKKKMSREAEKNYKTALRLNPEHYPSYINLVALLAEQGRVDEAIKVCQKGLEFLPDSASLHYKLGCLLSQSGQKDEAIKEFRIVLKMNPEHNFAKQDLETLLKESK